MSESRSLVCLVVRFRLLCILISELMHCIAVSSQPFTHPSGEKADQCTSRDRGAQVHLVLIGGSRRGDVFVKMGAREGPP